MPRPAKHDRARILAAAAALVAEGGPRAATIGAIGAAIGAPSGSIYHRFRTRDELLGRLWLDKAALFQDRWMSALELADPLRVGLEAALSLPRTVREDPDGARIMLLYRREDFLSDSWPPEMREEAERLGAQALGGIKTMTLRLFGHSDEAARQATALAVLDLPYAAVRRYVAAGKPLPDAIDGLIERAYRAIVEPAAARPA